MRTFLALLFLLLVILIAGFSASLGAQPSAPQDPPEEVECAPKEGVEDVYGTLCGSTMLWSDSKTPGLCDQPYPRCIHDNIIAQVDLCPGSVYKMTVEGQSIIITGTGPWRIEYDQDPVMPDCGGDPVFIGLVLRNSNNNPIGGKLMKFWCTPCDD